MVMDERCEACAPSVGWASHMHTQKTRRTAAYLIIEHLSRRLDWRT
jgi:hypothetical protein